MNSILVSTTNDLPGAKITKSFGLVRGSTVRSRNFLSDAIAGIKMTIGGEVVQYTRLLADAREQALQRMIEEATKLGANAIIGVRFTTSQVMQGCAEILAYGTAVLVENSEDSNI